jgi:hypothetical protein
MSYVRLLVKLSHVSTFVSCLASYVSCHHLSYVLCLASNFSTLSYVLCRGEVVLSLNLTYVSTCLMSSSQLKPCVSTWQLVTLLYSMAPLHVRLLLYGFSHYYICALVLVYVCGDAGVVMQAYIVVRCVW